MTTTTPLALQRHASVLEIGASEWNALAGSMPFLRHEFLAALEHSGCIGAGTAWQPAYLTVVGPAGQCIGAMPLYLKHDSQGEFVFDWGWADAYQRAGGSYYPKLLAAVPFTPATGARLLVHADASFEAVADCLIAGARNLAAELDASSLHVLFPNEDQRRHLDRAGFLARKGCQFHWHNNGYVDFENFLGCFSSAKRKKARRERRRITEAGIGFEHLRGDEIRTADWDAIFAFYARSFLRRGRAPYLNRAFFEEVARSMPEQLLVILARHERKPIACAICFRSTDTLYGRYWGSLADFHSLHFEVCYYQGIEYCIRQGLQCFEPGTQGEHKIARGFAPTPTWSSHWIRNPGFATAVADFLDRERGHVDAYMREASLHLPYRADRSPATRP